MILKEKSVTSSVFLFKTYRGTTSLQSNSTPMRACQKSSIPHLLMEEAFVNFLPQITQNRTMFFTYWFENLTYMMVDQKRSWKTKLKLQLTLVQDTFKFMQFFIIPISHKLYEVQLSYFTSHLRFFPLITPLLPFIPMPFPPSKAKLSGLPTVQVG